MTIQWKRLEIYTIAASDTLLLVQNNLLVLINSTCGRGFPTNSPPRMWWWAWQLGGSVHAVSCLLSQEQDVVRQRPHSVVMHILQGKYTPHKLQYRVLYTHHNSDLLPVTFY